MSDLTELDGRLLVVFDGHCGLCQGVVRWLLRRDGRDRLRFAPSTELPELLARAGVAVDGPETILVQRGAGTAGEAVLVRSDAVLACLRELPGVWPAVARIVAVVPRGLRDLVYRLLARVRYRIWGRYAVCPLPTEAERAHFL
jgi:predicted DCC family thiol-disulfide oxidoreductase YuxK